MIMGRNSGLRTWSGREATEASYLFSASATMAAAISDSGRGYLILIVLCRNRSMCDWLVVGAKSHQAGEAYRRHSSRVVAMVSVKGWH